MLLMLAAVFVYFLPSFIARHRQSFAAIFLFNFFLGWTFVGWIIALFWACLAEPRVPGHRRVRSWLCLCRALQFPQRQILQRMWPAENG